MNSFDFNSLDDETRQQTLAYFKPNPEPQPSDDEFVSYRAMLGDALEEKDWLEEMQEELEGEESANLTCSEKRVKMLLCTWTGCDELFPEAELVAHLTGHGEAATLQFHAPSSCVWPGCSSKATFKELPAYKRHLKNIHVEPLLCPVAKCPHKKPFRDQDDLDRHSAVSHSDVKAYHCPYGSCDALTKTFARRDKWLKHIQETIHDNDAFCPYYHCVMEQASASGGFKDRKQISKHFSRTHARNGDESYECALGSCANAPFPSYWSESVLANHVSKNHGLEYWHSSGLVSTGLRDERTVMDKHLRSIDHHDCKVCSSTGMQSTTPAGASTALGYQNFSGSQVDASTMTQIS